MLPESQSCYASFSLSLPRSTITPSILLSLGGTKGPWLNITQLCSGQKWAIDIMNFHSHNNVVSKSMLISIPKGFEFWWNRLEQITFCQCTNFCVHEDVCHAWSYTQKLCTHVVIVHWSKYISRNPLPGCIQNTDKNQPSMSMSTIATFNYIFFKAMPYKSVQYWVPMSKLHTLFWESFLHVFLFWLWQDRLF